jgi:hypothetical protein
MAAKKSTVLKSTDPKPPKAKASASGKVPVRVQGSESAPKPGKLAPASQRRFWLTYPPKRIQAPLIWELGHKFPLTTNIRQASVTDEVGIVCLEISGPPAEIQAGVLWLKRMGVSVEPVELSAVES